MPKSLKLDALLLSLFLALAVAGGGIPDLWARDTIAVSPPQALPIIAPRGNEALARQSVITYLTHRQALNPGALNDELLAQAYDLAGEARVMYWNPNYVELFPPLTGYRYVVGRADGAWTRYWSGCQRANQVYGSDGTVWAGWGDADTTDIAVHPFPGLEKAKRAGVAVAWRRERAYVAVIWEYDAVCKPQPTIETGASW